MAAPYGPNDVSSVALNKAMDLVQERQQVLAASASGLNMVMVTATRAYEANLAALRQSRDMARDTINMGRSNS